VQEEFLLRRKIPAECFLVVSHQRCCEVARKKLAKKLCEGKKESPGIRIFSRHPNFCLGLKESDKDNREYKILSDSVGEKLV
jgi:hypothetical protein